MGLPTLLNQHLPRHWKQQGLDWGWVATIWLSYILSEGDHRKVMVREWVDQRRYMLEQVCGVEISDTDFSDERLAIVLRQLSQEDTWQSIEQTLTRDTVRIYALPVQRVRLDATTMSGHHLVDEEGLFQYGHSKDDPNLPQIKAMLADLDPLGMPVATQAVSGQTSDAGIEQLQLSFGWRVYVTNAPTEQFSCRDAVLTYRDEWIAERGFHRFKGKSLSHPIVCASGMTRTTLWTCISLESSTGKDFKAIGIIPGNLFRVGGRVFRVVGDGQVEHE